jgi:hypothetical protein
MLMIRIVALHGTGDCYLICSLVEAFQRHHGRGDVEVMIKEKYRCIAEMFGVRHSCDDKLIFRAETDATLQRDYDNVIADDRPFYAHPSFLRTNMRIDHLTTLPDVSQAAMYKILLRVPPDAPLSLPKIPQVEQESGKVVVIPHARSWPNTQPEFWPLLDRALREAGWNVCGNSPQWKLRQLFEECASAEWVIGVQCGVMSILVTGRFPCRKTFATPDVDHDKGFLFSERTFPYGYVTKFSNQDYDVEEFKIASNTHFALAQAIVGGSNALRLWPHDPRPVTTVAVPLSPGDFLDRLAVLTVKYGRFPQARRAAIEREFQRHNELRDRAGFSAEVDEMFGRLVELHSRTFDLLEGMVPAALGDGTMAVADHVEAVRLNKQRADLKREIDAATRSPYTEQKSYHG